jgi:pimeloyl-ACP methyl ester carboxylesterase
MNFIFKPWFFLAALLVAATHGAEQNGGHLARREDRQRAVALSDGGSRTGGNSAAWLRGNFANVAAAHPVTGQEIYCDRTRLPGIGDSSIPTDKIDMITSANRIHALVHSLGIEKARVVGHDIGLMVAYAYATQFLAETEKLVVMDAFLPGVAGWEPIYNAPNVWHFRFNGEYPERLVKGRERTYFEYFWNVFAADKTHSIPEADRKAYTEAYSKPGRMRAAWVYFASWPELAKDFAQLSQTKLTMPVLSIGGEKSLGNELAQQIKLVATDATVVVLKDTGHWILEERPKETTDALVKFL